MDLLVDEAEEEEGDDKDSLFKHSDAMTATHMSESVHSDKKGLLEKISDGRNEAKVRLGMTREDALLDVPKQTAVSLSSFGKYILVALEDTTIALLSLTQSGPIQVKSTGAPSLPQLNKDAQLVPYGVWANAHSTTLSETEPQ